MVENQFGNGDPVFLQNQIDTEQGGLEEELGPGGRPIQPDDDHDQEFDEEANMTRDQWLQEQYEDDHIGEEDHNFTTETEEGKLYTPDELSETSNTESGQLFTPDKLNDGPGTVSGKLYTPDAPSGSEDGR